jgi:methionyl-tRNA synthetase
VLNIAAESLRFTAILLAAVLPESTERLWRQLGMEGDPRQRIDQLSWGKLPVDQQIGKLEPLFPRLEKGPTLQRIRELSATAAARPAVAVAFAAPAASATASTQTASRQPPATTSGNDQRISIDEFAKVDMRVGEVKSAELVKGANKLLRLTVDIGQEVRQIVAGIAEAYRPEELVGRKVVIVANLQPRKLRGVESNGMVVAAAVGEQGSPVLVSVPADTPNGARLR